MILTLGFILGRDQLYAIEPAMPLIQRHPSIPKTKKQIKIKSHTKNIPKNLEKKKGKFEGLPTVRSL